MATIPAKTRGRMAGQNVMVATTVSPQEPGGTSCSAVMRPYTVTVAVA